MNVESVAAIAAAMEYIAGIGVRFGNAKNNTTKRGQLAEGYGVIQEHEENISRAFLKGNGNMQSGHEVVMYTASFRHTGIEDIPGLTMYGSRRISDRTSTFCLRSALFETAGELNDALLARGIVAGASNFYALYFSRDLGLEESGGFVRIGFVHYNSLAEVERVVEALREIHHCR